jgi:hypothetical protein
MKLENQVTNLELSKKLKELGVKQTSTFYWKDGYLNFQPSVGNGEYSAFTVAELGELVMKPVNVNCGYSVMANMYVCHYGRKRASMDKNLANALAKMLIYLIENKLIKI